MNNQQKAFEKLSRLKVGALFMETGTGKTKVALDLISSKENKVDYVLWICPFSIKNEIEAERLKWHAELIIEIVGCESIGSSDRIYLEILKKVQTQNTFIVVDESLKIKNKDAKRTERILSLGENAEYKLILNGTPLSKNILDLWTQMQFLSPKILNMSYDQFKNTYTEYYLHGRLKGRVKCQHNVEHLISLIRPYIFDCNLEISAKKQYIDIHYSMSNSEIAEYERIKKRYLDGYADGKDFDFFSFSQMLQSHYCACVNKKDRLQEVINFIDDKVIVFVKYLKSIPNGVAAITGNVSSKDRTLTINQFRQGKTKVLYMTYGCGAFGLNLQFCKNIIFADHTFDYAQRIQAEARIYRIGQADNVNYYNLWCDIGLERIIRASLDKKTNLLNEVKKEIENKGVKEWAKTI